MERRRITLEDGRYLIFYTFDDEPAPRANDVGAARAEPSKATVAEPESKPKPKPKPEAEEERSV